MPDINAGDLLVFEHGGRLLAGTATPPVDAMVNIVAGTLKVRVPGRERWNHTDRGALIDTYLGNAQESEIELDIAATNMADTDSPWTVMRPADTANKIGTFNLRIEWYTHPGGNSGWRIDFTRCYLLEDADMEVSPGSNSDRVKLRIRSIGTVTRALITPP
jgi:hypothetical protein